MRISDFITDSYQYNWEFIESVPEFARLKECEQSTKWHSEGSAWEHTKKVCVAAQDMIFYRFGKRWDGRKKVFLAAALFHDIGKGVTTFKGKDNDWHSYGHEIAGERITRSILWDEEWFEREQVCALVRWHMEPSFIFNSKNYLEKMVNLSKSVNLENLITLKMCDCTGSEMENKEFKSNEMEKLNELLKIASSMDMNCIPVPNRMPWNIRERMGDSPIPIYVMIGLPCAGKTTAIGKIAEEEGYSDYSVISVDNILKELGHDSLSDENKEEVLSVVEAKMSSMMMANREAIFIDYTNLNRSLRDAYKKMAGSVKVKWIYVYVESDVFAENVSRTEGRMSDSDLKKMISEFDWPAISEYDNMMVETNRD